MKKEGLFAKYISPAAKAFPKEVIDPDLGPVYRNTPIGIVYNKGSISSAETPRSLEDLPNPKYRGKFVMGVWPEGGHRLGDRITVRVSNLDAWLMLQCADEARAADPSERKPDPEFLWSVYLRVAGPAVLEVAAAVEKKVQLLRGPERMFYGLVEFEVCDPDGYRICVGGEAPPSANVKVHQERDNAP